MKRSLEGDEFRFTCKLLRQPQGAFDRFCPSISKKGFLKSPWRNLSQFLGQIRGRLSVIDIGTTMNQFIHLGLGRFYHLPVTMPSIHHSNS